MLYFHADPRDGGPSGAVCNTCCCQPISLRPGETNVMTIDYSPWSLPITPPGIVPGGFDYSIEVIDDACADNAIDGNEAPMNAFYNVGTDIGDPVSVDLSASATPVGGAFTYSGVPLNGPFSGTATINMNTGELIYTPNASFSGWDVVWYEMTDQYGRTVTRSVVINVGEMASAPDPRWTLLTPYIDRTCVKVDQRYQTVRFPIYMPPSCRGCEVFRLTIRQMAQDCDPCTYSHFSCFDIRCRDCH